MQGHLLLQSHLWSRIFLLYCEWINILTSFSLVQLYIIWCEYLTMALKLERNLLLMLDGRESWALGHWLDVYNKQNSRSSQLNYSVQWKVPQMMCPNPCPVLFNMPSFGLSFEPQCTLSLLAKQLFFELGPKNHGTFDFYVILFIEVSSCGWTLKLS